LYLFLPRDIYADLDIYTRICDSPYAFITSVADIIISFSIGMRLSITSFSDETMYFCVYTIGEKKMEIEILENNFKKFLIKTRAES
jgi:hypothetical protein